jgi:hypothetical protein
MNEEKNSTRNEKRNFNERPLVIRLQRTYQNIYLYCLKNTSLGNGRKISQLYMKQLFHASSKNLSTEFLHALLIN